MTYKQWTKLSPVLLKIYLCSRDIYVKNEYRFKNVIFWLSFNWKIKMTNQFKTSSNLIELKTTRWVIKIINYLCIVGECTHRPKLKLPRIKKNGNFTYRLMVGF